MLLISTLHETVLSLCESLLVFFFYTSTLDKELIAQNFKELFRLYNNKLNTWKSLLNSNQIQNTIERLSQEKLDEVVAWRKEKNTIKWQIVLFCSILLFVIHVAIGLIFMTIKSDPIPMILRNTLLVCINACIEILFAHMILQYRFI